MSLAPPDILSHGAIASGVLLTRCALTISPEWTARSSSAQSTVVALYKWCFPSTTSSQVRLGPTRPGSRTSRGKVH